MIILLEKRINPKEAVLKDRLLPLNCSHSVLLYHKNSVVVIAINIKEGEKNISKYFNFIPISIERDVINVLITAAIYGHLQTLVFL